MENFGERLRQAIIESPFNQKDFAKKLDVHKETITNYVNEISLPKADMLYKICNMLGVSADWLLFDQEPSVRNNSNSNGVTLGMKEYDLLSAFRQLNEDDKAKVLDYTEEILKRTFPKESTMSSTSPSGKSDTGDNHITA